MAIENYPPIFSSDELDQNEARKRALTELVVSREALSIVGAGSSALVGHDTWGQLLTKLEVLAQECGSNFEIDEEKRNFSHLEYAQNIKDYLTKNDALNKYYNLIYKLFRPRNPPCDDFHRTLVQLPFKGLLTTNYDTVLETALGETNSPSPDEWSLVVGNHANQRVSEFLLSLDSDKFPRRVAHLHGKYDFPESIILSLEDYIKIYKMRPHDSGGKLQETAPSWSPHRKLLWALLATRRVVFIGFGMSDPLITGILDFVSSDLWRWDESVHFAIMPITQRDKERSILRAKELRRELGVEVVFYEDFHNSHVGLRRLIAEIAESCRGVTSHGVVTASGEEAEEKEETVSITPVREHKELKASSGWLEAVNSRMEKRIRPDED